MDRFEKVFWSGQSLEELYRSLSSRPASAMAALFVAAMREWKRSFEAGARSPIGLQMRIDKVLDVTISRETERLESRLLFLATVGSAGPFIGLFGTVWGIMTSFQAIAASKNTSLAVVAPGIAEALMATALGLLAAIPAVIAYNKLAELGRQDRLAARRLRRRILRHPVAPDRREELSAWRCRSAVAAGGGGRAAAASAPRPRVMSEINVTPFVDVMLVLLIIFMVSAPLLTAGVPIDLPREPGQGAFRRQGADFDHHRRRRQGVPAGYRDRARRDRAEAEGDRRRPAMTSASSCAATRAAITARSCRSWARSASAGYRNIGLVTIDAQGG